MLHGLFAGLQDVGTAGRDGAQPDAGTHHEQAAVPEIVARLDVGAGGGGVGFFSKAGDAIAAVRLRRAALDVAITCFRPVGDDAKGDHGALCRGVLRLQHGGVQRRAVGDDVVGGHGQQQRVGAVGTGVQGGQGERRCGVAAHRFEQDGRVVHAHGGKLAGS